MKKILLLILLIVSMQSYGQYYIGKQMLFTGKLVVIDTIKSNTFHNNDTLASQRWVRDNFIAGTGTVTSVATNTGTGITGGTITTTGLLALDTTLVSTRRWRQKGIDSVAGLIQTYSAGYGLSLSSNTFKVDTGLVTTRLWLYKVRDSLGALISASGITSLNGLTGATQTFLAGSSGSDFNISSSGTVHTFNIPDASAFSRGVVTIGTQTFEGTKTFDNNVFSNGSFWGVAHYTTEAGSMSNPGAGKGVFYGKTDNLPYFMNDAGTEMLLYNASFSGSLSVSLTDGANITTDATLGYILGSTFTVTLGGNRTMDAPSGGINGQRIIYRITQDGTGNRTLTWNSIFRFSTDTPTPTLSTAAGAVDYVAFIYNGADSKYDCTGVNIGH